VLSAAFAGRGSWIDLCTDVGALNSSARVIQLPAVGAVPSRSQSPFMSRAVGWGRRRDDAGGGAR